MPFCTKKAEDEIAEYAILSLPSFQITSYIHIRNLLMLVFSCHTDPTNHQHQHHTLTTPEWFEFKSLADGLGG